jgi:hypothetical protein
MGWQLWVLVALGVVVLAVACATRFRRASKVLDRIMRQFDDDRGDEVARLRRAHAAGRDRLHDRRGDTSHPPRRQRSRRIHKRG